jgi:hypothetical protein
MRRSKYQAQTASISSPTPNDALKRAMRLHRELVDMR